MPDNIELIAFCILATLSIITAIGVISASNPVRSALLLVVNFVILAGFYFMLQAQFLGIVHIIVYVGAILVLFLFVIMLLNLGKPEALKETGKLKPIIAFLLAIAFIVFIGWQVSLPLTESAVNAPSDIGTAETVGKALFTQWVFPFEITSILLLIGVIGSILLAKRRLS